MEMQTTEEKRPVTFTFIQKFILFIRQQGVIGLAVAVVLGGAVQKVVTALVNDIITPLIGVLIGNAGDLKTASFTIRGSTFLWGDFVSTMIDFIIIAFVIHANMLDKPKE